ncbi:MAG TPA: hydrogenase expression/formation C-terminal domain-containing protein [Pelomicrobium sp.]|nr:hydrogenase expression/formation C-terminal domain-containing protein [Pelomicrobium sp.]
MKPIAIPVRAIGPGSQPTSDDELALLSMPREMPGFEMPALPHAVDARHRHGAADVLLHLIDALRGYRIGEGAGPRVDLAPLPAATREALDQALGEGEVSAVVAVPERVEIQETVFAGVWRVRHLDAQGRVLRDLLEACDIPEAVALGAAAGWRATPAAATFGEGIMNAPMLLKEIAAQSASYRPGAPAHVVNLTLLPMSPADQVCLSEVLADGGATLLSRGFGKCRITSTTLANTWWVRYFNSVDTLILNTVEVVDVPEVAKAAQDDLDDTRERLLELADWLRADWPAES